LPSPRRLSTSRAAGLAEQKVLDALAASMFGKIRHEQGPVEAPTWFQAQLI
jgi:hypothetical protein